MVWNFILYLLYGLAFFTLGVAILSTRYSAQRIGNCQNYLAACGFWYYSRVS